MASNRAESTSDIADVSIIKNRLTAVYGENICGHFGHLFHACWLRTPEVNR